MVTDKGFYVDNYVGTYRMEFCKDLNAMIIVSAEQNYPMQGEKQLKRKRLFEHNARDNDYIYIALANVDLNSDASILAYCNRYGLPYSSQLIYEKYNWLGPDVDVETASRIALLGNSAFCKNDMMTKTGFCEAVIIVRELIRLQELIREKNFTDTSYTEFVSVLLFFTFFSHINHYSYDPDEYALPRERLMRFQYEFHLFRLKHGIRDGNSYCYDVIKFLDFIEQRRKCIESVESTRLQADISSTEVDLVIAALAPFLYSRGLDGCVNIAHSFTYESFGDIKFESEVTSNNSKNNIENLRKLGLEVFRSIINEGLEFITPSLSFEDGMLRGDWKLSYQMSGIYMELFLEASSNALVRQCANPTCGHYFSVSRSDPRKRYCCRECAVLEAKRRERRKKKERREQE